MIAVISNFIDIQTDSGVNIQVTAHSYAHLNVSVFPRHHSGVVKNQFINESDQFIITHNNQSLVCQLS